MKPLFILTLLTIASIPTADAAYTRFWRGYKRTDLSSEQFLRGLNEGLLPATGALRATPVGILAYQPVVLPQRLVDLGLPAEAALLEYESESRYQAYRATAEGRAYGDLHFEYFSREGSGSQVPGSYARAEMDKAYEVISSGSTLPSGGFAFFRAYLKGSQFSEQEFLSAIDSHIQHVAGHRPLSLHVSVNRDYAFEYVVWSSLAAKEAADVTARDRGGRGSRGVEILDPLAETVGQMVFETRLKTGRALRAASGIRYSF